MRRISLVVLVAALAGPASAGCGVPVATIVKTAADIANAIARVLGFLRDNGSPVERVERAADLWKAGEASAAFGEIAILLQQAREAGVSIPDDVTADFTAGMAAAYAIEQGLRGLHCRNPDGSPDADCASVTPAQRWQLIAAVAAQRERIAL